MKEVNVRVLKFVILSTLSAVIVYAFLYLFKAICTKYWHSTISYKMWYLVYVAMFIPLLPKQWIRGLVSSHKQGDVGQSATTTGATSTPNAWSQTKDYTLNTTQMNWEAITWLVTILWLIGVFLGIVYFVRGCLQLRNLVRSTVSISEGESLNIVKLHSAHKRISVAESPLVETPVSFWWGGYWIIIPTNMDQRFSAQVCKYMMLHELAHIQRKDPLHVLFINLLTKCFWFNPILYYVRRHMKKECELIADQKVLTQLQPAEYKLYGQTLIASTMSRVQKEHSIYVQSFSGKKVELKQRILQIKNFHKQTHRRLLLMIGVVLCSSLLIVQIPLVGAQENANGRYTKALDNLRHIDEHEHFRQLEGSFVLFDQQRQQYAVYNESGSRERFAPDSTFKIYLALFGLDQKKISAQQSTKQWQGESYPFAEWEHDQDVQSAMRYSVNWYFEKLNQQVGNTEVRKYLQALNYGNETLSNASAYWQEDALKVSNLEQVKLLATVKQQQLDFRASDVAYLDTLLHEQDYQKAQLYGKTGTGKVNGKLQNGWYTGYVTTANNTYYFSTHVHGAANASGTQAKAISKAILKERGIIND